MKPMFSICLGVILLAASPMNSGEKADPKPNAPDREKDKVVFILENGDTIKLTKTPKLRIVAVQAETAVKVRISTPDITIEVPRLRLLTDDHVIELVAEKGPTLRATNFPRR